MKISTIWLKFCKFMAIFRKNFEIIGKKFENSQKFWNFGEKKLRNIEILDFLGFERVKKIGNFANIENDWVKKENGNFAIFEIFGIFLAKIGVLL